MKYVLLVFSVIASTNAAAYVHYTNESSKIPATILADMVTGNFDKSTTFVRPRVKAKGSPKLLVSPSQEVQVNDLTKERYGSNTAKGLCAIAGLSLVTFEIISIDQEVEAVALNGDGTLEAFLQADEILSSVTCK
jgi:hypothetical protein